ncbi:YbaN family protein [Wielerella bovis]|uniref:YbaN family protein n=1 Tax=Wielerella bovis TaxID=2917790 RepID=UPI003211DE3B
MTLYQRELLFWTMSALLFIVPFIMIWTMPASRIREILLRIMVGITCIVLGLLCAIMAFVPHIMPHSHSMGAYTFSILTTILIGIPIGLILLMPKSRVRSLLINGLLWLVGAISLILGIIGAFLPVMPTVPFILLTAACWGRASPRFHAWLHRHPYFGPMVKNWEERRAISKRGKYTAWTMMSISSIGLLIKFPERWYVGVSTGLICLCVGIWMSRLPDA